MQFLLFFIAFSIQLHDLDSNDDQAIKYIQQIIIKLQNKNLRLNQLIQFLDELRIFNLELMHKDEEKVFILNKNTNHVYKLYFFDSPRRFRNGDEIVKKLNHKNICKIFKIVDLRIRIRICNIFLKIVVMENLPIKTDCISFINYVDKKSLELNITNEKEKFDLIVKPRLKIILKDILEALNYLHSLNYCFSDLKTENIMLIEKENEIICKLIDFESIVDIDNYTFKQIRISKPYMPLDEKRPVLNEKYDIYCLGMLAYFLINGKEIHDKIFSCCIIEKTKLEPEKFINELNINDDLKNFIILCLQKESDKRPNAKTLLQHSFFNS
ncbi:hypothetical protein GVAV_002700 [Gurleya vavrai]